MALLQGGENPLWFELGEQGPALIPSPEEASLSPFVPWPLARRVAGIISQEDQGQDRVILGVNREGFLAFVPWADDSGDETSAANAGIALYRIDHGAYWKDYSVESLFVYDGIPAALLYRDDFFIDSGLPPPSPRVWGLGPAPEELFIPAFQGLPPEEGWDIESLREGPDGGWHYRAVRKGGARGGIGYFRAGDLSLLGMPSTAGAMQAASHPRPLDQAPPLLRQVLTAALEGTGSPGIAWVASPEFSSLHYYANPSAMKNVREELQTYPGYYRRSDKAAVALAVSPAGRGWIGLEQGGALTLREFALPPLPPGFAYTGLACLAQDPPDGGAPLAVLAAWEEQDGWNVGAAGFVLAGE
jgi:hypothetical protein